MDKKLTYEQLLADIDQVKSTLSSAINQQDADLIDDFVSQLNKEQTINENVGSALTKLVTEQNIKHPKLVSFLTEIMDRLNKMGI